MEKQSLNTKANAKKVRIISMVLSLVAIVLIGLSAIMPLINIHIPGHTDTVFDYNAGVSFVGWQVTFYHFGTSPIIADRQAFLTNPVMIAAMVGGVILLAILVILGRKGKRLKKGVLQILEAAVLIFVAIVYLNVCPIVFTTAGNLTHDPIAEAMKIGGYTPCWYAVLLGIVCIVFALAKICFAIFNIAFRRSASKHPAVRIEEK